MLGVDSRDFDHGQHLHSEDGLLSLGWQSTQDDLYLVIQRKRRELLTQTPCSDIFHPRFFSYLQAKVRIAHTSENLFTLDLALVLS